MPKKKIGVFFGVPKEDPQEAAWKEASGDEHIRLRSLQHLIKWYSYQSKHDCELTDEKIAAHLVKELSLFKRHLYSISDMCFSLHVGDNLMRPLQMMRDEVDIFSDEIKIRHCEWDDIPANFLRKMIRTDHALFQGLEVLLADIDALFRSILAANKKKEKPSPAFWNRTRKQLLGVRNTMKELVILFKEREAICNINPITLKRTFQQIQREIRDII